MKLFLFRRVHITQATLDYLGGEYEVEPGNGASRNQYLRDHCVTTYFIVPPARRRKVDDCLIMISTANTIRTSEILNSSSLKTFIHLGSTLISSTIFHMKEHFTIFNIFYCRI